MFKIPRLPYREDTAFGFLAILTFLVPLAFVLYIFEEFETIKFSLSLVLLACALISFVVQHYRQTSLVISFHKAYFWTLGIFLFWSFVSALFAADKLFGFFGSYYRFTNGFLFYALLVVYQVLLLFTLTRERLEFLLKIIVFDSFLVSLLGVLQTFGVFYYAGLEAPGLIRAPSLLGNPDFSAMFVAVTLPILFYLWRKASTFSTKIYYALNFCLGVFALAMFSSRGAVIAAIIGGLCGMFMALKKYGGRKFFYIFAGFLVTVLLAGVLLNINRPGVFGTTDINISLRLIVWQITWQGIIHHPLVGVGLGNYALFFERARGLLLTGQNGIFDDAHNLLLHIAVTGGLPLFGAFLGLILISGYVGIRGFYRNDNLLAAMLAVSVIIFVVATSFNPVSIPCYILLGIIMAGLILQSQQSLTIRIKPFARIGVVVCAIAMLLFGLGFQTAEFLFAAGYRAYYNGNYGLAMREFSAAKVLNPTNQLYYLYRAGSSIQLHYPDAVIRDYIIQAGGLHPTQAYSQVIISNLYHVWYEKTGNQDYLDQAIQNLQKSLQIDPQFSERYSLLGLYYYEKGDLATATSNLEHGLSLNEDQFPAWILSARISQLQNNRTKTLAALNKALHLKPDIIQLQYLLSVAKKTENVQQLPINISLPEGKLE